jgi:hypothetical protein
MSTCHLIVLIHEFMCRSYWCYMHEVLMVILFQEGETIRINVKNKPTAGSGMLSAAGLSGGAAAKPKASMLLAPPPGAAGKPRSPLPPPPNDPAAARMSSGKNTGTRAPKEPAKQNNDPFSNFSAIKVSFSIWCAPLVS